MEGWADLNERQQTYMQAIYATDQENEAHERSKWSRGGRPRPAAEWRWMFYGIFPETGSDSPLRHRLKVAKLVDPGTGATFEALEKRGYIQCRYELVVAGDPLVYVQMTPKGRKLVREATGQKPDRLLPGQLREWHWRALAETWKARPQGVKDENGYYGHISWNTWLRLRDYKIKGEDKPLLEEYKTAGRYLSHVGYTEQIHWIRLTPFGEQYYRENWQRYHALYPNVEAPEPEMEPSS
jgi:hypothetical protein